MCFAARAALLGRWTDKGESGRFMGTSIEVVDQKGVAQLCPHPNMDYGGDCRSAGGRRRDLV